MWLPWITSFLPFLSLHPPQPIWRPQMGWGGGVCPSEGPPPHLGHPNTHGGGVVPLRAAAAEAALRQGQKVGHLGPEKRFDGRAAFGLDGVDSPHLRCNQSAERERCFFSRWSVIAQTTMRGVETRLPFHLALLSCSSFFKKRRRGSCSTRDLLAPRSQGFLTRGCLVSPTEAIGGDWCVGGASAVLRPTRPAGRIVALLCYRKGDEWTGGGARLNMAPQKKEKKNTCVSTIETLKTHTRDPTIINFSLRKHEWSRFDHNMELQLAISLNNKYMILMVLNWSIHMICNIGYRFNFLHYKLLNIVLLNNSTILCNNTWNT